MFVVPDPITPIDEGSSRSYACPLCRHQTYPSKHDTGWVQCPMIRNRPLCLGCCIDLQGAAVAEGFAGHPDHPLFEKLSRSQNKTTVRLRLMCLDHQLAVIDKALSGMDDGKHEERAELRERVLAARQTAEMDRLGRTPVGGRNSSGLNG